MGSSKIWEMYLFMLVTPANLSYSKFAAYKKQKAKSPGRWVNERAGLLASA
jgi:hypothetical protein